MLKKFAAAAFVSAAFLFPAAAQDAPEGPAMKPDEAVNEIYLQLSSKDEKGCATGYRSEIVWFSIDLLMAYKKDMVTNEMPSIDFDPFTNAQDVGDVTNLTVSVLKSDKASAEVSAQFDFAGGKQNLLYVLKVEGGDWAIDDIKYTPAEGDAYSMCGILGQALQ